MTDVFNALQQTQHDIETEATCQTISDDFDEINHYVGLYQTDWRKILHQYHVLDPDDLNHYAYDQAKYDTAFNHNISRWITNDTYQPLDLNRADDIVSTCLDQWADWSMMD